jgi:hypothetical protein
MLAKIAKGGELPRCLEMPCLSTTNEDTYYIADTATSFDSSLSKMVSKRLCFAPLLPWMLLGHQVLIPQMMYSIIAWY